MNIFNTILLGRRATALLIAIGSLAGFAKANAQVLLTFSGGGGAPISITLATPVSYTITYPTPYTASNFPTFVFENVGNIFSGTQAQLTPSAPSFSRVSPTSDGPFPTQYAGSGANGNAVTPIDLLFGHYGSFSVGAPMAPGDVFTLSAGTFTTVDNYSGLTAGQVSALSGSYTTFLADGQFHNLGVGASAIPEPSTYAAIAGAATLGLALWHRRRRQMPTAAMLATNSAD